MSMFLVATALGLVGGWGKAEAFCTLDDRQINESSGLAVSGYGSGVFYTHNDSGDSARFFRFEKSGKVTGVFGLKGVKAVDWEEMAQAKLGGKSYMYLGDIGDNARKREFIEIHRVEEPKGESRELDGVVTYRLKYPDKARDCEGMFVDPGSGDIYLVTKARDRETVVYVLKAPAKGGSYTLTKLGNIEVALPGLGGNLVTGAAVSGDGKRVVVRTYTDALEFVVSGKFSDWWKQKPLVVKLAREEQGEAICYSVDSRSLLTSTEGVPCRLSRVPWK